MNTSPNRSRPASGQSSGGYKPLYDEERLDWEASAASPACWPAAWPKRWRLRRPRLRPRRTGVVLFLVDLLVVGLLVFAFEPLITLLLRNEELFGARLSLPLAAPHHHGGRHAAHRAEHATIPRILHQTSATTVTPDRWITSQESCREMYSDFEYKHWTDELARDFIALEYPWFLETWDSYPFPIQRADAIRYFVLYHYGGLYLDMDTICNETIPLHLIEADGAAHHAVFKSTKPTGISNDLLISSAHHPLFAAAIANLLFFNAITKAWAHLQPHAAVMISAGPFFLTMTTKNYLLSLPSLPTPAVQVVNATELAPYITDLEDCSWHHGDTKTLMWVGERPWVWFLLGAIGLTIGLHILNRLLLAACRGCGKLVSAAREMKEAKVM